MIKQRGGGISTQSLEEAYRQRAQHKGRHTRGKQQENRHTLVECLNKKKKVAAENKALEGHKEWVHGPKEGQTQEKEVKQAHTC